MKPVVLYAGLALLTAMPVLGVWLERDEAQQTAQFAAQAPIEVQPLDEKTSGVSAEQVSEIF